MGARLERQRYAVAGCCKLFVALRRETDHGREVVIIPARCKSWACPRCARRRAKRLAGRVRAWGQGKRLSLFTVTMAHDVPIKDAWRAIAPAWNRWRTAYTKRYGRLRFVRVLEPQPNSQFPHLHVLVDRYIDWEWNTQELAAAGFGFITNLSRIDGVSAMYYVLKYLAKPWPDGPGAECATELRMRRFSCSRDCRPDTAPLVRWQRCRLKLNLSELYALLTLVSDSGGLAIPNGTGDEQTFALELTRAAPALRQAISRTWFRDGWFDVAQVLLWAVGKA